MAILAFDTSCRSVSAAVLVGGHVVGRFEACDTGHAERLLPLITAVMADAGVAYADVTRIAVTVGPGGFTGVRVGIAAARGLALATGAPVVGLSSLAAMALGARTVLGPPPPGETRVLALPAGRGAAYVLTDSLGGPTAPELVVADVAKGLRWPPGSVGMGAGAELLSGLQPTQLPNLQPDARIFVTHAEGLTPQEHVRPIYLRAADARPQTGKSLPRAAP